MEIIIPLVILLFSAVIHEIMHGFVALKLGDPTAKLAGRLTLNPIPHIDPLTTVILPAVMYIASHGTFFFAAAKPVSVNPIHFKDPKKDMALTSLAGPLTNLVLAIVAAQLLKLFGMNFFMADFLFMVVYINLMLAIFNLIPIPPLDGSSVLASILPDNLARSYLSIERYGIFILLFLLYFPIGGISLGNIIDNLLTSSLRFLGL